MYKDIEGGVIMGKKKKKGDIIVSCVGESISRVTGSSWSILYRDDNYKDHILMIECGLPQGGHTILESYNDMKRMSNRVLGGGLVSGCENLIFLHSH